MSLFEPNQQHMLRSKILTAFEIKEETKEDYKVGIILYFPEHGYLKGVLT